MDLLLALGLLAAWTTASGFLALIFGAVLSTLIPRARRRAASIGAALAALAMIGLSRPLLSGQSSGDMEAVALPLALLLYAVAAVFGALAGRARFLARQNGGEESA